MHQINLIRRELREYFPWHGAQLDFLALLLVALYRAKTVNLTELASVFSNHHQLESNSKRLYSSLQLFKISGDKSSGKDAGYCATMDFKP